MATYDFPLAEKSLQFVIEIVTHMRPVRGCGIIKDQLLRAGTSIGANIREAQYAYSSDDFVFKLQTALKECNETGYWLDVLAGAGILTPEISKDLRYKRNRIHRMLVSSLNTKKSPYAVICLSSLAAGRQGREFRLSASEFPQRGENFATLRRENFPLGGREIYCHT